MNSFFSIIIPVYNISQYLRACLDSVLAQTFQDWEAICIDDGSTDESGAILDEYAAKDKRFRVIHKANGGVSSARNAGLDAVRGEWVAFLDGDDVWAPWTLERVAKVIEGNQDADLVRFDTADFYESGKYPWGEGAPENCEMAVEDLTREIKAGSATCFFGGKIYKHNLVDGIRFEPYTVGEDLLFLTQCMMQARKQIHIKIRCYGYRQRVGSASHSGVSLRTQRDELEYVPKVLKAYDTSGKIVDQVLWRTYTNKLVERFCVAQLTLSQDASDGLWHEWRDSLKGLLRLKQISRFQRIRIELILMLPFNWVAYVLCCLPYWIKARGWHR